MPKINCTDGCLDNYSAECVKYTGASISIPSIPQNTNFNTIVNILVDAILAGGITISPDIGNIIQVRSNGLWAGGITIVPTFADVIQSGTVRFIQVTTDETNDGDTTLYWWNGTTLNWIPSQTI